MTDTNPDEVIVNEPLFTEREERLAKAIVGVDEKWREAGMTNPQFQNQLFYMVRVLAKLFDQSSSRFRDGIEELDLTVRAYNVLKREHVDTIGELTLKSRNDLLDMRNMGLRAIDSIQAQLATLGLKLKGDDS